MLLPIHFAVGNNFQIRVPIDDTNTLHIRYETGDSSPARNRRLLFLLTTCRTNAMMAALFSIAEPLDKT